jgi:putative hemolysin
MTRSKKTSQSKAIADRLLEFLEISYTTSETDLARIPASGAAVVTVNHPFGILDGAILASLLTKIRPDVRFLANGILSMVPELREMVIPVDPTSGRSWTGLVRNRHAFRERLLNGPSRPALPNAEFDLDSTVVSDIEQKQTAVPVLLRQYLRLGGKLLGFNVDPKFADALDGLILLDLTKTKPKLLERYLGKTEATAFLEFQKGNVEHRNGTH